MPVTYLIISIFLCVVINSCTSGRSDVTLNEVSPEYLNKKVRGEAYLFDVKLRRDGKPTSFRLEIYQADTITAFSGRGYLGKGALKGIVDKDSILVYFPTLNEYLYESTTTLLDIKDCVNDLDNLNLLKLLKKLPDDKLMESNLKITSNYENAKKPKFAIFNPDCSWKIDINYDKREPGWRIKSFFIDDGHDNTIKSERRTYKRNANIPYKRFIVSIPDDAERIIP